MKNLLILAGFVLVNNVIVSAQRTLSPPREFDRAIDERTIKNPSLELERFRRDSKKPAARPAEKIPEEKFLEIKGDFEKIQRLQSKIVKFYTTGKQIEFAKIAKTSVEMSKSAVDLKTSLFAGEKQNSAVDNPRFAGGNAKNVKDLIVELDGAISRFVGNPIFRNLKVVDLKQSEAAQDDLSRIIVISRELTRQAAKSNAATD